MVTVTTAWDGGTHAESALLRAELDAALRGGAHVAAVAIDHTTGNVDVEVRLPADVAGPARDRLRAQVRSTLETVIEAAFAEEGLALRRLETI